MAKNQAKARPEGARSEADWVAFLADIELLSGLDEAVLQRLAAELTAREVRASNILIRQGDPGDGMYVVIRGRLRAVLEQPGQAERVLREMGPGESIGEIALLTGQTRTATVYALEDTTVAWLAKESFDQLVAATPTMAQQLQQALTAHIRRRQLRSVLQATRLFSDLDELLLRDLEAELSWVSLTSGESLIRQGEPGDCMYVIVSGRLRVVLEQAGQAERVLRELGRGESIGEIALLTGQPRTATVYAIRDAEVAKLSKESFDRLLGKHPHALTKTFTRSIIDIVLAHDAPRERQDQQATLSLAVIPAGTNTPLTEFTRRLVQAFATLGATLHLSSSRVDNELGKPGIAQEEANSERATAVQLIGWLSDQESTYRYLVYEADAELTPWTQRCLRQADHILLVGLATDDPTPSTLEVALANRGSERTRKQTSLALLHSASQPLPVGTQRWLARRRVNQHHQVRWNRSADFARVARIIAGRAIGLALGGGGARGAAQIGVLRALEEANIPIDMVGGTSMGAVMASFCALGWDAPRINRQIQKSFTGGTTDPTLPLVALTTGRDQVKIYKELFGDIQIEDLWLPYFCVSTNLTRAEEVVHRTGSLWEGVRASSAAPGIFPPVVCGGDLLVDGALLNNLPMNIMREQCGNGIVIAVDVTPPVDLEQINPYGEELSGWQALLTQVTPWSVPGSMPNIVTLLYRAGEVGSVHALKTQLGTRLADLYLRPPVERFGLLEWKALNQIIELGYHYAKEQLAQWQHK